MRTILSQLGDDTWCNTFASLNSVEHSTLTRVIRPFAHGKHHERQVLVLKVIKEAPKLTAWTALLRGICRGSAYPSTTYRDGRVLLAIVREQFIDGKPLSVGRFGSGAPPPPPPLASQYVPSGVPGVFRPAQTSVSDMRPQPLPPRAPSVYFMNGPPLPPPLQGLPPPPHGYIPPHQRPARSLAGPVINTPGSSICTSDITTAVTNHEAAVALTTFKEYTMRRCQAESPDKSATWLRVNTTLESSNLEAVRACVSRFEAIGGNVLQAKLKLTDDQGAQVARVMANIRATEFDMRFEWCWAVVALLDVYGGFLNGSTNASISLNTYTIHLIAKRSLGPSSRPLETYNSIIRISPPASGHGPLPPPRPNYGQPKAPARPKKTPVKSTYDSGSDSSVGFAPRKIRKFMTRNRKAGEIKWVRNRYVHELSSDSDSDSDSELETKDVKLKRGEDIVKRLLEMWTPQERSVETDSKA
jgi:hypothetical protein